MVFDQKMNSFLSEAASKSPTPGGGSIAALAAALGAAMGSMVANLTMGPKYEDSMEIMKACVKEMEAFIGECEKVMVEDINAFQGYMNALKMPKETAEDKLCRSQAIQEATLNSTAVPLKLMSLCNEGLDELLKIVNHANKNVISDLGIGAILLEAAAQSAYLTVKMNLPVIKDLDMKQNVETEAKGFSKDIQSKKKEIEETVFKMMG